MSSSSSKEVALRHLYKIQRAFIQVCLWLAFGILVMHLIQGRPQWEDTYAVLVWSAKVMLWPLPLMIASAYYIAMALLIIILIIGAVMIIERMTAK